MYRSRRDRSDSFGWNREEWNTYKCCFRPSDNQEIILYYSSENATLDSTNSEFWVDNGIDDPHILTLGRILKVLVLTEFL